MNCKECGKNPQVKEGFCQTCLTEIKICRDCQKKLSIFLFEKNQRSMAGKIVRRGSCIDCRSDKKPINAKAKKEYEKINPSPKIGVKFTCPICQKTITRQYTNDVVLDHSHKTGKIRGWICRMCNSSMGMLGEDKETFLRAIQWLEKNSN